MDIDITPDTAGREHYSLNEAPWIYMTVPVLTYTLQHAFKFIAILETQGTIPQSLS